jgi:hypothetical protein
LTKLASQDKVGNAAGQWLVERHGVESGIVPIDDKMQSSDLLAGHFQVDVQELLGDLFLALVVSVFVVHLEQRVDWYTSLLQKMCQVWCCRGASQFQVEDHL